MPPVAVAALLAGWARGAVTVLEHHRADIDRINVFPVPDGDTGTNLLLTMRSAVDALDRAERGDAASVANALARGALLGARGNSGMILSQVLRGFADAVAAAGGTCGAGLLADALGRGAALAAAAFTRPRAGTALSVLAAAAEAAERGADLVGACAAAAAAAEATPRETTAQLPELARAGVVDAGGMGLYLVLDALACCVAGRTPPDVLPVADHDTRGPRGRAALTTRRETGSAEFDYEVMYLLDAGAEAVERLRGALAGIGDSVAAVGDGSGLWNVHVHCNDVGAAIEAGIGAGRPHRITVVRFADRPAVATTRFGRARAVLMVVTGPEVAALARAAGAAVLERGPGECVGAADLVAALAGTLAEHVVLIPDDPGLVPVAEAAATTARAEGQDVLILPTSSVLQGLAALAVHDPSRRPGENVVSMTEVATGTRVAALLVAESEALTWVGRCEPGDVLGLSDGEVVLIAPDLAVGALWLAHRMLLGGGEIVTALLGAGVDESLGDGLAADLRRTHPEVDVVVQRGGQTDYPLVLGVE